MIKLFQITLVLIMFILATLAMVAFGEYAPESEIINVSSGRGLNYQNRQVHKFKDRDTTCYIFGHGISCVKS